MTNRVAVLAKLLTGGQPYGCSCYAVIVSGITGTQAEVALFWNKGNNTGMFGSYQLARG